MLRYLSRKVTRHYAIQDKAAAIPNEYRSLCFLDTLVACDDAHELPTPPRCGITRWCPAGSHRGSWGHDQQPVPSQPTNAVLLRDVRRKQASILSRKSSCAPFQYDKVGSGPSLCMRRDVSAAAYSRNSLKSSQHIKEQQRRQCCTAARAWCPSECWSGSRSSSWQGLPLWQYPSTRS